MLLCWGAGSAADPPGQDAIVLGMSGALTGASASLGLELRSGMQAWFDHVNRNGGVHGRRIELKVYDDGYNPEPAIYNTLQLIERDGALALLGYVGTPTVTRVLPLLKMYENENVLLFFPFSGARESFFGDLHGQGRDAFEFFTQEKVVVERWPKEWTRKF